MEAGDFGLEIAKAEFTGVVGGAGVAAAVGRHW